MLFDKSFKICETIKAKSVTNLETAIVSFYKDVLPAIIPTCPLKGILGVVNQTINVNSAKDFPLIMERCRAKLDMILYTMQNDFIAKSTTFGDFGPPTKPKKKKKN
jgi:hypothetical protein